MESEELIREVWAIVHAALGSTYRLYLMGSRASGTNRAGSDFDFALLGDTPVPFQDFLEIKARLATLRTLYKIDLVDLAICSEDFRSLAERDMREVSNGKI